MIITSQRTKFLEEFKNHGYTEGEILAFVFETLQTNKPVQMKHNLLMFKDGKFKIVDDKMREKFSERKLRDAINEYLSNPIE